MLSEKITDAIKADVQRHKTIQDVQLAFSSTFNTPKTGNFSLHDLSVGYFKALVKEVEKEELYLPEVIMREITCNFINFELKKNK